MGFRIVKDESDENQRNVLIYLTDLTNGYEPETGIEDPTIQICKSDETSYSNGAGTWTEVGNGSYYYGMTQDEVDTYGVAVLRVVKSGITRDFIKEIEVTEIEEVEIEVDRILYVDRTELDISENGITLDVTEPKIILNIG